MAIVYLNGDYLPQEQALISPMDRGFLFGDGLYEVIPFQYCRPIGFTQHIQRLLNGMKELGYPSFLSEAEYRAIAEQLLSLNAFNDVASGVYFQVTRGAYAKRYHGYPEEVTPTVFAFAFTLPAPPTPDVSTVKGLRVTVAEDKRWQRCHIKSTSLLGNVIHFQGAIVAGVDETILVNAHQHITEASTSNVFVVVDGNIITPPLDHQLLPGITRALVIESLSREGISVTQSSVSIKQLLSADEVWLTSASKDISPVISIDGHAVGTGAPGEVWKRALHVFNKHKFDL